MFLNSVSFIIRMPFYCESALRTPTGRQIDKHIVHYIKLKIVPKQKDQTTNTVPYDKSEWVPAEKDVRAWSWAGRW